ncbi:MAG TPA: EVE domain-containing protein [Methanoregula sp.]|nr:EVE domain-containing protein [Methanoregula sp.]
MKPPRYWIIVASKEHVMLAVNGGFAMANHGKRAGLARMHAGDRIICYSPKVAFGGTEPLHAFTALGTIADNEIVQEELLPGFTPFRRKVRYEYTGEIRIDPLVRDLGFIRNKRSWGAVFRFGLHEIPEKDFRIILKAFEKEGTKRE